MKIEFLSYNLILMTIFTLAKLAKSFVFQAYEAKSFSLRLYMITEHKIGKILVCGGRKKTQIKDIERLKRIIKEYSHFKN
jgi:hypothetical protein